MRSFSPCAGCGKAGTEVEAEAGAGVCAKRGKERMKSKASAARERFIWNRMQECSVRGNDAKSVEAEAVE